MKKQIQKLMIVVILIATTQFANAQWSITGNAGTNNTNFLGTTDAQPLRFKTNAVQHLILDATGRLGIGVTSPIYKIDVSTTTLTRGINSNNSTSSTSTIYGNYSLANNAGTGGAYGLYSWGRGALGTNYGIYGRASEGDANYAIYGYAVGAATTNYGVYATASGATTNWAGYFVQNAYMGGAVGVGTTAITDSKLTVQQTGTTLATAKLLNTSKGPNVSWVHFGTTGDWYIRSSSNSGKVILQDQNAAATVCIGSTTAATGYRLSVAGKIICEELKVLLKASWPDYVFAKDYNLMPLNELQSYIDENKHLPGIPSAPEMEEDGGIAVGEMQTVLVKKLEEANLYILQLNKRLEELESKLK